MPVQTSHHVRRVSNFTEKLQWMNAQTNQADIMGPNLVYSYPNHTK